MAISLAGAGSGSGDDDHGAARLFYGTALASMYTVWLVLSVALRRDFYVANAGARAVLLRPSWCPAALLRLLHMPFLRTVACHLPLPALAVAWWHPELRACRVLAAAALSVCSLVDTSATHSHRGYGNLYCAWLLALLPPAIAQAGALGVCVHYIASSGIAKVFVAGSAGAWCAPRTLQGVLRHYGKLPLLQFGPALPRLTRWLVRRPFALALLSWATLAFEVVGVPLALVLPPATRPLLALASVGLHTGVALAQSVGIGLAFLPSVAAYGLGFAACGPVALASYRWFLAVAVAVGPTLGWYMLRRTLLPEDWPCTNFALFGWSGAQWDFLFEHFSRGDLRLVITTAPPACADAQLEAKVLGARVVPKNSAASSAARSSASAPTLHDAWEQVVGETLVFPALLNAIRQAPLGRPPPYAPPQSQQQQQKQQQPQRRRQRQQQQQQWQQQGLFDGRAWLREFAMLTSRWLAKEGRLVEFATGDALRSAYAVRVDADGRVVELL